MLSAVAEMWIEEEEVAVASFFFLLPFPLLLRFEFDEPSLGKGRREQEVDE